MGMFSGFTSGIGKYATIGGLVGGPIGALLGLQIGGQIENMKLAGNTLDLQNRQFAEQKKQADEQKRIAEIRDIRARRDAIRQARITRATIANTAANAGVTNSSGAAGADASIGSQTASNLGYLSSTTSAQNTIFDSQVVEAGLNQQIGSNNAKMQKNQAIGNIAGTIFSTGATAAKFFM